MDEILNENLKLLGKQVKLQKYRCRQELSEEGAGSTGGSPRTEKWHYTRLRGFCRAKEAIKTERAFNSEESLPIIP